MLWSSILASIYSIWWWQVTFDEVNTAILIIPWCYTHPLPMSSGRLRPRLGTEPLRHPVDLAVRCLGWRARLVEGSNATGGVLGVWGWEIGGFNMLQPWKMLEVWALFIVEKLEGLASNLGFTMMFQYGKLVFLLSNNCRSDSGFVLVFEAQDFLRSSQSCRRQIPQDRCLLPVTGAARPLLCRCCSTWTGLPPFRRWLYPWLQVGPWHFQDGGWSFCGFLCRTILTKGMKPHRSLGLEPLRFSWAHWICLDCDTWKLVGFKKRGHQSFGSVLQTKCLQVHCTSSVPNPSATFRWLAEPKFYRCSMEAAGICQELTRMNHQPDDVHQRSLGLVFMVLFFIPFVNSFCGRLVRCCDESMKLQVLIWVRIVGRVRDGDGHGLSHSVLFIWHDVQSLKNCLLLPSMAEEIQCQAACLEISKAI